MGDRDLPGRFTRLYREHHARVHAYAVARVGRQLAEEVVAESFLVAWRRIDAVPADRPLPWLLATARNVVRERYRAEVRQQALAGELHRWTGPVVGADIADDVAERAAVLNAVAQLSETDREVLILVAWHGLSPRDAATVLGCSRAAYVVRLHRARRRLEQALDRAPGAADRTVPLGSTR